MSTKVIDPNAQGQIQFIQSHQMALETGQYKISIEQTVKLVDVKKDAFSTQLTFVVQGNRFELTQPEIHAVFPPAGSLGDHSHVLPHVALKSSTLPWERLAQPDTQKAPWLALILIHEGEKLLRTLPRDYILDLETPLRNAQDNELTEAQKDRLWQHLLSDSIGWLKDADDEEAMIVEPSDRKSAQLEGDFAGLETQVEAILAQSENTKLIPLGKLQQSSTGPIKWPGVALEIGQQVDDNVAVIDVPKTLLAKILPTTEDLEYLAHVRQVTGDTENSEPLSIENSEPLSVVISNRLPKSEGTSTAYLVSLENRYSNGQFNDQNATDDEYIRLVALKSWSFACTNLEQNFAGHLKNLDKETLRLATQDNPTQDNPDVVSYLAKGYRAFPHYLRQGGKTFSWYHSPLSPGENPTSLALSQLAIRSVDQLIAYNPKTGLFDISYAAAWQLGQLLALQDKQFATRLFNWKRANAQKLAKDNQQALYPHLFAETELAETERNAATIEFPTEIQTWFERLGLLYGIPFNYLVPDEQMLPTESIRFFCLDWFWVESLLDGAFSIGRVQDADVQQDSRQNPLTGGAKHISGFLIRSDVIAGWPDLQIEGSEFSIAGEQPISQAQKLTVLRCDRLSENILLCLFDGAIRTVDISLKPEGLHFGFNHDGDANLWRELRKLDGTEMSDWKVHLTPVEDNQSPMINQKSVVNITNLANCIRDELQEKEQSINNFTAAQFALQMIQGVEKVRFSMARSA
ncbi:hypothetical protein IQ254_12140 [Nodosilinea sp. LEGE 07088]|uniref:hypothetical protein n=1 Tax=Nodosilinea sp. LEGE 07088 TaxID=2777968 RepID=UPI00187EE45B|nr:hypothetical protein [Nodosilinea sp. LEGE 07088]MBE9137933.1 hypothetical protein [Nodosilinea sp. LEGE 07088]